MGRGLLRELDPRTQPEFRKYVGEVTPTSSKPAPSPTGSGPPKPPPAANEPADHPRRPSTIARGALGARLRCRAGSFGRLCPLSARTKRRRPWSHLEFVVDAG